MCRTNDVKSRLGVYDNDFEESVSLRKTGNTHPLAGDNYFSSREQASLIAENVLRSLTANTTQGDSHHHPHFIPHTAVEAENSLLLHSADDLKAVPWRANTEGYHSRENDDINENWETQENDNNEDESGDTGHDDNGDGEDLESVKLKENVDSSKLKKTVRFLEELAYAPDPPYNSREQFDAIQKPKFEPRYKPKEQ